jgi:rhodanese-related sulfurtransferase
MWWLIGLAIIIGFIGLFRRGSKLSTSLEEIEAAVRQGGQLIDVRSAAEYKVGHAKGAKNVPIQAIQANATIGGSTDKPVYLYCHSGARAALAKRLLEKAGYTQVTSIGSLAQWQRLGGQVVNK